MPEHEESVLAETAPFPFGPQNWNPQKIQTAKKDVAFVVFLFYTNYIPMYIVERALSIYNRIIVLLLNDQPHFFQNLFMGPGAHCHIIRVVSMEEWPRRSARCARSFLLFIKALGEQVPQIVREYLFRHHAGLPAEGFHFMPDVAAVQGPPVRVRNRGPSWYPAPWAYRRGVPPVPAAAGRSGTFPSAGSPSGQHAGPPP